jgi:HSP20 family protein
MIMTMLAARNPFQELGETRNLLSEFFGGSPIRFSANGKNSEWLPLVDISEDDQEYLFKADLPDVKKGDVKVIIENGVLSISGERKMENEEKKRKFHRLERFFGRFERTFAVPEDADTKKIVTQFRDGVLQVHLPKRLIAKPKPVAIMVQ